MEYKRISTKLLISSLTCLLFLNLATAQHAHPTSATYQLPADPLVKNKLETWRDQKFGMIIHWGLYAEAGIVESWTLCSEDWISRDSTSDYAEYKKGYWGLSKKFNPEKF